MLNLKKRLILDADINFDTAGTGEEVTFFGQDGKRYSGKKINASHMPLTAETRKKVAAGNVDQALSLLSDKVNNITADDVLTSDVTVVFEAEDAFDVIQDKINQQKKNLNGHTLTFVFPASLSQILYSTIIWQDFYNGTVKITGGTADRSISIYDQLDITALFRFYRCQCEVIVEYFHFIHQYSVYAIFAESSTAVIAKNCIFTGMRGADSYAIKLQASGGAFDNCQFNDDIQLDVIYNTGNAHYLGEVFAYSGAVPPEGAYLLNGQTIANCRGLYPKFWNWVNSTDVRIIDNETYEAELTSAGVCGGFVVDSGSGSVRLPKVVNGTLWGADSSSIGQSLAAGLPDHRHLLFQNTTGTSNNTNATTDSFAASVRDTGGSGGYSIGKSNEQKEPTIAKSGLAHESSIYGNSDTVQPPAVRVSWCIQVYNAATALSEQESAQLASQMQMKAQTDFGNVAENLDFVVESWSDSSGGWYRKYRSGWVEQGGIVPDEGAARAITINFWVEMLDTSYTPKTTQTSSDTGNPSAKSVSCYALTETSMATYMFASSTLGIRWEVKGYAATK
jgi:hypothetical protein